jgi:outer membrane protein
MNSLFLVAVALVANAEPPYDAGALPTPSSPAVLAISSGEERQVSLAEALRIAVQNQPTLRQASAVADAADAQVDVSFAPLLPQVQFSPSYEETTSNPGVHPGFPPSIQYPQSNGHLYGYWAIGGYAQQLIWDFGLTRDKWRSAKATAEAQHEAIKTTQLGVILNVRTAYFTAQYNKALINVEKDTVVNEQKHYEQTEGFVKAGTQPEISLAQAKTDLANAELGLVQAIGGYDSSKAQLNQAMGVEGPLDYQVEDTPFPPVAGEDYGEPKLLDEGISARPEMATLEDQIKAQDLIISSWRGNYYPSFNVQLNGSDNGINLLQQNPNGFLTWNYNVELNMVWNLYQGGLTPAQIQVAEANRRSLEAQRDGERQQIRLDVEQAMVALRTAKSEVDASQKALDNAKEQLRLADGRYSTGVGSIIELGDAQVAETTAAGQRVKADDDLATARAQLIKALGRL